MNKQLLGIGVIVLLVWLAKKKPAGPSETGEVVEEIPANDSNNDKQKVFDDLVRDYGVDIAKNVEKIYRYETRHFDSLQFKKTNSAGMLKLGNNYPWGWTTPANTTWKVPELRPNGDMQKFTKNGKEYTYIVLPSFRSGAYTLAAFLKEYNNNPGRWNSTEPTRQQNYTASLKGVRTTYVQ